MIIRNKETGKNEIWYFPAEMASRLNVTQASIYNMVKDGRLESKKIKLSQKIMVVREKRTN